MDTLPNARSRINTNTSHLHLHSHSDQLLPPRSTPATTQPRPSIRLPMLGPVPGLPPPGQQQVQQQHQQQQQHPNNGPPPPPLNGQDLSLSNVLHFLQTEWRRYERDRNEWEIERAEMRARIALLEGERRSFENVKLDLMRRIKMLEYALRMERSKQLTSSSQSIPLSKLPPNVHAQLTQESGGQKGDTHSQKDGSSPSSPRSEDIPLPQDSRPNGIPSAGASGRPHTLSGGTNWSAVNGVAANAALGKAPPGRDPKSRARSRDFLKQCLQEISYLTSQQAMNPLPNRPILNNPTLPLSIPNVPSFDQMPFNGRPRKVVPEAGKEFPMLNGMNLMSGPSSAPAATGPQVPLLERHNAAGGSGMGQAQSNQGGQQQQSADGIGRLPPPSLQTQQLNAEGQSTEEPSEPQQLTAIFRPDDEWRERLRLAHEESQQRFGGQGGVSGWDRRTLEEEEDGEVEDDETSGMSVGEGEADSKAWKPKRTLRNHLDAARAISFHPTEMCLATGGDDCTVKIWRMDVAGLTSANARVGTEVEPQLTLRGHAAPVTQLVHSGSKHLLYSASLDATIRVWVLPSPHSNTYGPYDGARSRGELIGHTDAVWDIALVRDESALISCGADGFVKVWDVSGPLGGGSLKLSWAYDGVGAEPARGEDGEVVGASALEALKADLKKVAVAYTNAVIKIFDIETGEELSRLQSDEEHEGTPATQINSIVSHPTLPLLVAAYEGKYIRLFDTTTGQCTHSMLAHTDAVTSLSIDASGFSLVSGGHDCSVRFWDLIGTRACVQETTNHREKGREGVLAVEFHPSLPFVASAGADGVIKLYSSSS